MALINVSELSFIEILGLDIEVGFRAYSVCAEATFAHSQYAQKLLLRIQQILLRSLSVCQSVWENVRVAAL